MSASQVLSLSHALNRLKGRTDHQHCMPVVGAGIGCGEAIGKFGVGRFKMLCRSNKMPLSDWPKVRTGRLDK